MRTRCCAWVQLPNGNRRSPQGAWLTQRPACAAIGLSPRSSRRAVSPSQCDQLTLVALLLLVHERYASGTAVAGVLVAQAVPQLLGPLAGTIVDQADRRRLLRVCELGRAAAVAAIAIWLPPLPALIGLVGLSAALATLARPASRSALPALVSSEELGSANATMAAATNIGLAIGPALGGVLSAWLGPSPTMAIDAATSILAAMVLGRLPTLPAMNKARGLATIGGDTVRGIQTTLRHVVAGPVTISIFLGVAMVALSSVAGVFLLRDALGGSEAEYGFFGSSWGLGMISVSALLIGLARRLDPRLVYVGGWLVSAFALVGIGLAPTVSFAIAAAFVGGIGNGLENVGTDTLIQRTVPERILGKTFGSVYAAAFAGELIAFAAAGLLLELLGPRALYVGAGLLLVPLVVWLLCSLPSPNPPVSGGRDAT